MHNFKTCKKNAAVHWRHPTKFQVVVFKNNPLFFELDKKVPGHPITAPHYSRMHSQRLERVSGVVARPNKTKQGLSALWKFYTQTNKQTWNTAYPTCSDIFKGSKECSKLRLLGFFCQFSVKRDLQALASSFASSFWKCHCRGDMLYMMKSKKIKSINQPLPFVPRNEWALSHKKKSIFGRIRNSRQNNPNKRNLQPSNICGFGLLSIQNQPCGIARMSTETAPASESMYDYSDNRYCEAFPPACANFAWVQYSSRPSPRARRLRRWGRGGGGGESPPHLPPPHLHARV